MFRIFGIGLIGVLLLAACSGEGSPGELTIVSDGFQYEPEVITLVAGETVTLTFDNRSAIDHEFNLDTLPIAEGQVIVTSQGEGLDDHHGDDHQHFGEEYECEDHAHEEIDDHEHEGCSAHEHEDGSTHFHSEHGDSIPTVHLHAAGGDAVTLTFTPTEPGTYEVYCAIDEHYEKGHHGTIIVKAP